MKMNRKKLNHFRHLLLNEKSRLVSEVQALNRSGLDYELSESIGELSVYDNHPADIADVTFEREKDLGLKDNELELLANIEESLAKIENGTYGECDICGKEIGEERLESIPYAVLCIDCQRELEEDHPNNPRPAEEDVLERIPFEASSRVGFDAEDTWQAVERYNETPKDRKEGLNNVEKL